jgi:hypothetical protein
MALDERLSLTLGCRGLRAPCVHDLIAHVARCLVAIVVPGAALVTVLGILKMAGLRARNLPSNLWLCLLLSAAIVLQPLVINPEFPGFSFNEQRLAVLFIASLQHIYTVIGPSNTGQFVAIQLLAAALIASGLVYARLGGPAATARRDPNQGPADRAGVAQRSCSLKTFVWVPFPPSGGR